MSPLQFETPLHLDEGEFRIRNETLQAGGYIEFLARTNLGEQYPQEHFAARIEALLRNLQISLVVRSSTGQIVAMCFRLTDFAYWLFITDLGVGRRYERQGIGGKLVLAHELAGGERNILQFCCANEEALPFYESLGMCQSTDVMEKDRMAWTSFTVGKPGRDRP